jgi:hypothetical protein
MHGVSASDFARAALAAIGALLRLLPTAAESGVPNGKLTASAVVCVTTVVSGGLCYDGNHELAPFSP